MWIKKFVLGGAAVPGGLKQAVARARASKDHTTFTVPTKFAVLVAALAKTTPPSSPLRMDRMPSACLSRNLLDRETGFLHHERSERFSDFRFR